MLCCNTCGPRWLRGCESEGYQSEVIDAAQGHSFRQLAAIFVRSRDRRHEQSLQTISTFRKSFLIEDPHTAFDGTTVISKRRYRYHESIDVSLFRVS